MVLLDFTMLPEIERLKSLTRRTTFWTLSATPGVLIKPRLSRLPVVSSTSTNVCQRLPRNKISKFYLFKSGICSKMTQPTRTSLSQTRPTPLFTSVRYLNLPKISKTSKKVSFSWLQISLWGFLETQVKSTWRSSRTFVRRLALSPQR